MWFFIVVYHFVLRAHLVSSTFLAEPASLLTRGLSNQNPTLHTSPAESETVAEIPAGDVARPPSLLPGPLLSEIAVTGPSLPVQQASAGEPVQQEQTDAAPRSDDARSPEPREPTQLGVGGDGSPEVVRTVSGPVSRSTSGPRTTSWPRSTAGRRNLGPDGEREGERSNAGKRSLGVDG